MHTFTPTQGDMYTAATGKDPFNEVFLDILGLHPSDIPRYRDCFLYEDMIGVYTRTGGGNREQYRVENQAMRDHPGYIKDVDDEFDSTYATFFYAIPENHMGSIETLRNSAVFEPRPPWERTRQILEDLTQKRDTPEARRAMNNLKPLMEQIAEFFKK